MTAAHTPVDDLIRDLGALRVAADAAHADAIARKAIEEAIWENTSAIGAAARAPESEATLSRARDAVQRTAGVISRLQSEVARSRRIASAAIGLRLQAEARRDGKP